MNSKFLLTTALTAFIALAAHAQSGGGGSGGSGGSSGSGSGTGTGQGQGTSQTTPGQPGTVTPGQGGVNTPGTAVTPGQGGQTQVTPPPVQNQIAPNVGRNTGQFAGTNTGQFTGTNAFRMNRNNLNTNGFGVTTNQFLGGTNMAPTGRGNNRVLGTNSSSGTIPPR
jgi:hypothetical protein